MITYWQLDDIEAMFEGTADWTCSQCFTCHAPSAYHGGCGQINPDGREHIPALLAEVRSLKRKLHSRRT